ncbi:MAG: hypothetical protein MRY32_04515 [Rickettsiales bacterium]|nr:hypothetical protein [Rickettsiales bacterium]
MGLDFANMGNIAYSAGGMGGGLYQEAVDDGSFGKIGYTDIGWPYIMSDIPLEESHAWLDKVTDIAADHPEVDRLLKKIGSAFNLPETPKAYCVPDDRLLMGAYMTDSGNIVVSGPINALSSHALCALIAHEAGHGVYDDSLTVNHNGHAAIVKELQMDAFAAALTSPNSMVSCVQEIGRINAKLIAQKGWYPSEEEAAQHLLHEAGEEGHPGAPTRIKNIKAMEKSQQWQDLVKKPNREHLDALLEGVPYDVDQTDIDAGNWER